MRQKDREFWLNSESKIIDSFRKQRDRESGEREAERRDPGGREWLENGLSFKKL